MNGWGPADVLIAGEALRLLRKEAIDLQGRYSAALRERNSGR
jgi:hypothetical protein